MSRLWEYDEYGEPWLENSKRGNPPLLIVNRKKKGKKAMSKYARRKSRARVSNPKRRRRARRKNPWTMAGPLALVNRPHRRRRKARTNRKRHYRRNPGILGIQLPPMKAVIYAGVGFVAPPMVEGFLAGFLPTSITSTTVGKYAVRIGSVLGLSWLTRMTMGRDPAKMVAIGGGAYILTTVIREFAPGVIPGLSAYSRASLNAYAPSTGRTFHQLGAPAFGAQNTVRSAGHGGANIVAARFRRFQ